MTVLRHGEYVIRTGAGLRKAMRHFNYQAKFEHNELIHMTWPKAYPCVVSFHWGHNGYSFLVANYTTFNKMRAILTEHDNCTIIDNPPQV